MMPFDIAAPFTLLGIGLASGVFLALVYFYGHNKRSGSSIFLAKRSERSGPQLIRAFSALAIVALLLSAVAAETGDMFLERQTGVIAYVCDESRSMGAEDETGIARIDRCKNALLDLDVFPYAEVAAYGFTDGAASHSSFSLNHNYFRETVRRLIAIEAVPGAGSDIGASLRYVVEDVVEKRDELGKKSGIVVVGSDWENIGKREELARALELANRNKITLVALAIAGTEPVPIPVYIEERFAGYEKDTQGNNFLTKLDEQTLRFVAERSGSVAVAEKEPGKARALIEGNLASERVKLKGAGGKTTVSLLFAALAPLVLFIRYSTLQPLFWRS